jgi:superfamily II DNA/RNA helicase
MVEIHNHQVCLLTYNLHTVDPQCKAGARRQEHMNIVSEGVEIIIATPGRLNDLVLASEFPS